MTQFIEATTQNLLLIRQLADQTFHVTYLPLQPKEKVDYLFRFMYSNASLTEQINTKGKDLFWLVTKRDTLVSLRMKSIIRIYR